MRLHPMFVVCFVLALLGAVLSGAVAITASACDPPGTFQPDNPCTAGDQLDEDTARTIMLASLVVMLGGVGFQIERTSTRRDQQRARPVPMGPPQGGLPQGPSMQR